MITNIYAHNKPAHCVYTFLINPHYAINKQFSKHACYLLHNITNYNRTVNIVVCPDGQTDTYIDRSTGQIQT
jgi:hypothetical protein